MAKRHTALLAAIALVMDISTSIAVELSSNGKGEVLIFPLATVGDGFDTLFNVRNTSADPVVARVVLRSGTDGEFIKAFRLLLSAYDTWTGALTKLQDQTLLVSRDTSCVSGVTFDTLPNSSGFPTAEIPAPIDQMWLEVFEMGSVATAPTDEGLTDRDCSDFESITASTLNPSANRLGGDSQIISVRLGLSFSSPPAVLQDFGLHAATRELSTDEVTLDQAQPVAVIGGESTAWETGIDAVSAVLAATSLESSFAAESVLNGRSDLILTFPTRPFYDGEGEAPFSINSAPSHQDQGQQLVLEAFTREGDRIGDEQPKCTPLPPPGFIDGMVVSDAQTNVYFGPEPLVTIRDGEPAAVFRARGFCSSLGLDSVRDISESGHFMVDLTAFSQTSMDGVVVGGLPLIAVNLTSVSNGQLILSNGDPVLSNYGFSSAISISRFRDSQAKPPGGHE